MSLRDEIAATIHQAYPEGVNGWYIADLLQPVLARVFEEGKCASARGVKNNPYIDNPSKDGEDG